MDEYDDDMILIAEANREALVVLSTIKASVYLNVDVSCLAEEGNSGSISKHGGVVTISSANFSNDVGRDEVLLEMDDE